MSLFSAFWDRITDQTRTTDYSRQYDEREVWPIDDPVDEDTWT